MRGRSMVIGVLMLVILWLGAVAELIYFPALLAGPLGSVFKPRKKPAPADSLRLHDPEPRPPQLVVIGHDDQGDEELPPSDGNGHSLSAPHGKAGQHRQFRQDTPHRRS